VRSSIKGREETAWIKSAVSQEYRDLSPENRKEEAFEYTLDKLVCANMHSDTTDSSKITE